MPIKNQASIEDEHVRDVRAAIEHRATWLYCLLDEARKRGLDWDDFARRAIFRVGCFHGEQKYFKTESLQAFSRQFPSELSQKVFEMEIAASTPDRYVVEFHYCPLVNAWQKLTDSEEEIAQLCDIAMEGDRGMASAFPAFKFDIEKKIAEGSDVCRLVYTLKPKSLDRS
jgi:hypothetical protein